MSLVARRCAIWLFAVSISATAAAESLDGTWIAEGLGEVRFKVAGKKVTGTARGDGIAGTFDGVLRKTLALGQYRGAEGERMSFRAELLDEGLSLSFDGQPPILLVRGGGASGPGPSESPGSPELPQAAALRSAPAAGAAHREDDQGWQLRAPAGWKMARQGARLIFGSDTEAGLIVAWYAPNVRYEQLAEHALAGYQDQNVMLQPASAPSEARVKGGRAVAIDLAGMGSDGSELKARAIGVEGPNGALAIVGLTTPPKFSTLRARVDAIAASVAFFKPKAGPVVRDLVGGWWHWSGSSSTSTTSFSSISRERTLVLCPTGVFFDSSSSDIYANVKNAPETSHDYRGQTTAGYDSQRQGNGRWSASGSAGTGGVLRLTYGNGTVRELQYRFTKPNDIELDGTWFGRDPEKFAPCQ